MRVCCRRPGPGYGPASLSGSSLTLCRAGTALGYRRFGGPGILGGVTIPVAAPPEMFGSVVPSDLLPWGWAEERLVAAQTYWVATSRPSGRAHVRPVRGVWSEDGFVFSTGSPVVAGILTVNPEIAVHLESGQDAVIVEGTAERLTAPDALEDYVQATNQKYARRAFVAGEAVAGAGIPPGPAFRVSPSVVFGWDVGLHNPTRWSWSASSRARLR